MVRSVPFDFSKLNSENSSDTVIAPRDIFTVLPNKHAKYQYPRDVQGEVWAAWFLEDKAARATVQIVLCLGRKLYEEEAGLS